jgi:hypothetical protein
MEHFLILSKSRTLIQKRSGESIPEVGSINFRFSHPPNKKKNVNTDAHTKHVLLLPVIFAAMDNL